MAVYAWWEFDHLTRAQYHGLHRDLLYLAAEAGDGDEQLTGALKVMRADVMDRIRLVSNVVLSTSESRESALRIYDTPLGRRVVTVLDRCMENR